MSKSRAGVTLLELLVAIALAGTTVVIAKTAWSAVGEQRAAPVRRRDRDDVELLLYHLKNTFRSVHHTHVQNLREYREILPTFAESEAPVGHYKVILSDWAVPEYDCLAALEIGAGEG